MFGKQAIRLLREAWGGVITPDAEGAYREKGAKQLAEELYSMFDSDIPLEHDGPITINKGSNAAPLTITNNVGGNSFVVNGGTTTIEGGFNVGGGPITIGNEGDTDNDNRITITGPSLDLDFDPGDITIGGVPLTEYIGGLLLAGGVGRTVFLGRVVSGTGASYTVNLYGNGSGQDVTATVTATVPQIYASSTLPAGLWLAAVHKFVERDDDGDVIATTYEFQPPIWMAPS